MQEINHQTQHGFLIIHFLSKRLHHQHQALSLSPYIKPIITRRGTATELRPSHTPHTPCPDTPSGSALVLPAFSPLGPVSCRKIQAQGHQTRPPPDLRAISYSFPPVSCVFSSRLSLIRLPEGEGEEPGRLLPSLSPLPRCRGVLCDSFVPVVWLLIN